MLTYLAVEACVYVSKAVLITCRRSRVWPCPCRYPAWPCGNRNSGHWLCTVTCTYSRKLKCTNRADSVRNTALLVSFKPGRMGEDVKQALVKITVKHIQV